MLSAGSAPPPDRGHVSARVAAQLGLTSALRWWTAWPQSGDGPSAWPGGGADVRPRDEGALRHQEAVRGYVESAERESQAESPSSKPPRSCRATQGLGCFLPTGDLLGRPTSLGSLLPAGSCCRLPRGGLSSALASITPGARRATSSSGATSRTSTARPTRGTSSGRDPSISRAPSSAPPRASRTGPRAASPGRERYNDARPSST